MPVINTSFSLLKCKVVDFFISDNKHQTFTNILFGKHTGIIISKHVMSLNFVASQVCFCIINISFVNKIIKSFN